MRTSINCHTDDKSGLQGLLDKLQEDGYEQYFLDHEYGQGINAIGLNISCFSHSVGKQPHKVLKDRIGVEVVLDYEDFTTGSPNERKKILGTRINDKIRQALSGLALPSTFESQRFVADHKSFLRKHGWL